ncbi:MAG: hypothetical protein M0R74_03065 [Dehalococcoidia bacterium]|jgi:hypothetical protein|nr:hypothetical protein [Dehalococcoidia bacterium]
MAAIDSYTDFYPLMAAELPGCPEYLMLQALKRVARKFCQDSDAWRVQLDSIDLVEKQLAYVLTPLSGGTTWGAQIKHVLAVRINTEDGIDKGNPGVLISQPYYTFYPTDTTRINASIAANTLLLDDSLEPAEDVTDGLEVEVVLVPELNEDDTEIDMDFLAMWSEAIIGGAIAYLMTMKKRRWTDIQRAGLFQADFNKGVSRARKVNIGGGKSDFVGLSA